MASTLDFALTCSTGGLEELTDTVGSPTAQSSVKYSGNYAYSLAGAATNVTIGKTLGDISANSSWTVVFNVYFTDLAPTSGVYFMWLGTTVSNRHFRLRLLSNGDLRVNSNSGAESYDITSPFSANTWHTVRIDWVKGDALTGKIRVLVDGSGGENETFDLYGSDSLNRVSFGGPVSGEGTVYIDSCVSWITTEWKPTDVSDDIAVGPSHLSDNTTSTDLGTALDTGTWDNASELPFSATNEVIGSTDNVEWGTDTDGGTYEGPLNATYSPAVGTVLGGIVGLSASRGAGAGTTHTIYGGSTNDTWISGMQSTAVTVETAVAWHELILDDAAKAPTTSEHFRMGFGKAGGAREWEVDDIVGVLLYEPDSGPPPTGYGNDVSGVASANIGKIDDVATANIAKVAGVA